MDSRRLRDVDPSERRLLLVASDERYAALVREVDWKKAGSAIAAVALLGPMLPAAISSSAIALAAAGKSERVRRGVEAAKEASRRAVQRGEVDLPRIDPSSAQRTFRFESGEPRDGTVYVVHPFESDRYLLPATSPIVLARERIALFADVAARLGARRIELVAAESMGERRGGGVRVPLPKVALEIGIEIGGQKSGEIARSVVREYAAPRGAIAYPDDLRDAIERDDELRALVRERLETRLLRARTTFRFRDDEGGGPEALVGLGGRGLRIGTRADRWTASAWTFEVTFWETT